MSTLKFASRLNTSPEYIFASLAKAVKAVEKRSGKKVLNLGPGSPDIPPSKKYVAKLQQSIREAGSHLYPGYQATSQLSDALIHWYRKRFDVGLHPDEIIPLLGAKDGVSHLPLALLDPGDEILVPDPGYPAYSAPALMIGARPVPYDALPEEDVEKLIQKLESKLTSATRCIWVNYPSNPTGYVATLEVLHYIVAFCKKHNLILLYDNAYSEITFDGIIAPSILQIPDAGNLAVEIGSFSKTFSFAGYRMGWVVGNTNIISALAKIKSHIDSGMPLPFQHLGAYALMHTDTAWFDMMITSYSMRRHKIAEALTRLGLGVQLPQGALYIWASIPKTYTSSEQYCMELLEKRQILLTPGSAFGRNGEGYVRVSICSNIDTINEYI